MVVIMHRKRTLRDCNNFEGGICMGIGGKCVPHPHVLG